MNWKWLLLALLLLLLLLWLCKGCLGCTGNGAIIPPVGEVETNKETEADGKEETDIDESEITFEEVQEGARKSIESAEKAAAAAVAKLAEENAKAAIKPKYDLESIYYDYNKWDLRSASKTELDRMVDILKKDESLEGEFLGHTDTRGSQKLNDRLSRKRAQAALNYVVSQGISKSRLSWKKFSEEKPKAQNDIESEQKLQLNRRVDLRILKDGSVVEDTEKEVRSMD